MNKKRIPILLLFSCFLISCNKTTGISTITSSSTSQISESTSSTSSSSTPQKKKLSVDNVYNDLLSLATSVNFTIYYSDF